MRRKFWPLILLPVYLTRIVAAHPQLGPGFDPILEQLAEVLTLANTPGARFERALGEYRQSISESRLDKDVYVGMRGRLLAASLVAEAEAVMRRAIAVYPQSRQVHFQLAEVYVASGKYEKALDVFQEAARLRQEPDAALERKQRGLIYAKIAQMNFFLVRFDDASKALTTALDLNPDSTSSRLVLGALYLRRNRFDDAAAQYRHVISADPGAADAHDGLAQVDFSRGRYSAAVAHAERALQIDPGLQSSRYVKAMALIRDGREEGNAVLQEYERREQEEHIAQSRLTDIAELDRSSSAMAAEERLPEAMELLRKGIGAHPLAAVLHMKLGLIQSRLGFHREAAETFETMVRLKLDDFLVHRQLSREYDLLGNLSGHQRERAVYLEKYNAALQQ